MRKVRRTSFLSVAVIILLQMGASPAAKQDVPLVDLEAVVEEMGRDLTYDYDLITGDELAGCEHEWEVELPYGIRDIIRLGGGNLLITSGSSFPPPWCEPRGLGEEKEEVLSVFAPDGRVLYRRSLGEYSVGRLYTSGDGKLVSFSTCFDHDCWINVTNHTGREYFSMAGGAISPHPALFPSSDGEYLVRSRPNSESGQIVIDTFKPNGERRPVAVGYFSRKDGSQLKDAVSEKFNGWYGEVVWAGDGQLLYAWRVAREDRCDFSRSRSALALLDLQARSVIWEKVHPPISYQPEVASGKPGKRFFLLDHSANKEGIRHTVIAGGSGEAVGRTTGWGGMSYVIGSEDGCFYASIYGRLKMDRGFGFRRFLVKVSPDLRILRHGVLWGGWSLHQPKELNGYVWGIHRACTLEGHCYPVVTAVYDLRGEGPSGGDLLSTRVRPVLLEGYWFIAEMTDERTVLIGQIDPQDGALRKIVVDRSWIDGERR